jgi:hypothetical protein
MYKLLLTLLLLPAFSQCHAQLQRNPLIFLFYFDSLHNPVSNSNAIFVGALKKFDDTTWEYNYYRYEGPAISITTYRDSSMKIPHGYTAKFDGDGAIIEKGYMVNGQKSGRWFYHNKATKEWREDTSFIKQSAMEEEPALAGCIEIEPVFDYGGISWTKYLLDKLTNIEIPLYGSSTLVLQYVIDTLGYTRDIRLQKSIAYDADEKVMSIIRRSPRWKPATLNGHPIIWHHKHPFVFCTDEN